MAICLDVFTENPQFPDLLQAFMFKRWGPFQQQLQYVCLFEMPAKW